MSTLLQLTLCCILLCLLCVSAAPGDGANDRCQDDTVQILQACESLKKAQRQNTQITVARECRYIQNSITIKVVKRENNGTYTQYRTFTSVCDAWDYFSKNQI